MRAVLILAIGAIFLTASFAGSVAGGTADSRTMDADLDWSLRFASDGAPTDWSFLLSGPVVSVGPVVHTIDADATDVTFTIIADGVPRAVAPTVTGRGVVAEAPGTPLLQRWSVNIAHEEAEDEALRYSYIDIDLTLTGTDPSALSVAGEGDIYWGDGPGNLYQLYVEFSGTASLV